MSSNRMQQVADKQEIYELSCSYPACLAFSLGERVCAPQARRPYTVAPTDTPRSP